MNKPITSHEVNLGLREESKGSLMMKELHLNKIGQLHITFKDKDGNLIDLDLDPVSQPTITPAEKVNEENSEPV